MTPEQKALMLRINSAKAVGRIHSAKQDINVSKGRILIRMARAKIASQKMKLFSK